MTQQLVSQEQRCHWCTGDELYIRYHDEEWGVPCHDDQTLFEFLILEGAQAGLNWLTILKKREGYRNALAGFDVQKVARFDETDIERLLNDEGIIRNRLKINSAITNARSFIKVQKEFGSFDTYIWQFVNHQPIINHWKTMDEVPVTTPESEAMSKDLKKRGFKYVGSTICYAYMQAMGMTNDHITSCISYTACPDFG
ncbi:DNA-3-methyladenine glycosylase I [Endozoicomonas gorgoniicola]|uniref:DNA-3-methyladenine glycosylase I n=1 Tax=Endozoicomonas gorgoniicola TaxID=1234144 RepID=A0ABT3MPP8_9GAMM|nr:DNA-3-methyladenine glycosylase I [Endozoicomonas gorgoniicola]MCW7551342.1 DNA-3-methyladenine glycosylase I [Endozoicomonas gorgoniicola]